jgi:SAM-dependent methyltransferase
MLDLFRRQTGKAPDESGGGQEVLLRSHIFQKFLRRLTAREHPTLLDLGSLSGANIEIFARLGCRVQVEDLLASVEESPGAADPDRGALETTPAVPLPAAAEAPLPDRSGAPAAAGARPSRRIVLPPRTYARSLPARPAGKPAAPYRSPLPSALSYPDASIDALVAWDLLNYYDPESVRRMAAEVGRVLKPGGIVFAYFHSRSLDATESPRRFRIVDEKQLSVEPGSGRPLRRHVLQNRDIEKLFQGLRIRELYFLKNGLREMLLEKAAASGPERPPAARPRPRFRID